MTKLVLSLLLCTSITAQACLFKYSINYYQKVFTQGLQDFEVFLYFHPDQVDANFFQDLEHELELYKEDYYAACLLCKMYANRTVNDVLYLIQLECERIGKI